MTRMPDSSVESELPAPLTCGPIAQADVVRFAGAGGDFNPLHHDPEAAQRAGFKRPIAMGQFTAALMSGWVTDWCGVENLRRFEVSFRAPVYLGDVLTFALDQEAPGTDEVPAGGQFEISLKATCGDTVVATGRAQVYLSAPALFAAYPPVEH